MQLAVVCLSGVAALGFAVVQVRALIEIRRARARGDDDREQALRAGLGAAFDAVARGDARAAIEPCVTLLVYSRDEAMRRDAVRVLAYAYATTGGWDGLTCLLESGGASSIARDELAAYARAARAAGRPDDARRIAALAPD